MNYTKKKVFIALAPWTQPWHISIFVSTYLAMSVYTFEKSKYY